MSQFPFVRMIRLFVTIWLVAATALVAGHLPESAHAQSDATTTVPDITGLSVPVATAELNKVGLALGTQTSALSTAAESNSDQPANTITTQAVAPGESVAVGSAVDVTVLRAPNAQLMYNTDVVTLLNLGDGPLPLAGVEFVALDGSTPARFPATNWANEITLPTSCMQLWSIRRTGPGRPVECSSLQRWQSTINQSVHFWTGSNAVTRFQVVQQGAVQAECNAAQPGAGVEVCSFYLAGGGSGAHDTTAYVYLAYTTDRLIIHNQSEAQWMLLGETQAFNYNPNVSIPGASLTLGDPALFENTLAVADVTRLAPGQCLFFTNSGPTEATSPEDCHAIAQLNLDPRFIFWAADFEIGSATDGRRHTCPAAREGTLTVCIMPR